MQKTIYDKLMYKSIKEIVGIMKDYLKQIVCYYIFFTEIK